MDSQKRLKINKPKPKNGIKSALICFLGGVPKDTHNRALDLFKTCMRVGKNAHIKIRILKRRNATLEEENKLLKQKIETLEERQGLKNAENRD